jgi:hypothetical protein
MKKMSYWVKPVALLALVLSTVVGATNATAATYSSTATVNKNPKSEPVGDRNRDNVLLARMRVGECRAVARSTFVYQERSGANRIRALQVSDRVTLAEDNSRDGWIAISSPISGFVQARDLKLCSDAVPVAPAQPNPSSANLCRQVTYPGKEGVAVRTRPNISSTQVGTLFFGARVTLAKPPQFIVDDSGREWVRISAPIVGWMSNGFPAAGDINLEACP